MNKLPLEELHKSLGANLGDISGCSVPLDYGDVLSEYKAVRENVGIIDLSSRGKLRLSGKDHIKFLQGMLTNDVVKLETGKGMYATILTVKGRMISDMKVYKDKECIFLDLEPELNHKVGDLLKKYRLSYKAEIEDITDSVGLISIQGPKATSLLQDLIEEELPQMEKYDHIKREAFGEEIYIVKVNRTGEQGFDIYLDSNKLQILWETLMEKGKDINIAPVGYSALNILRIEAGLPIYGVDMDEGNIPIEAGLWDALNFEKGCYVGQEVVARIKWRGHVNWHLMGFQLDGESAPEIGDEVYSGERKVGRITSSAVSPILDSPIALGYIRRELKDPGTEVMVHGEGSSQMNAKVCDLPFYKGSF